MKSAHIHVLFLLCAICVFVDADEVETVSVIEGGSVTLLTDVTEIKSSDVIEWRFNGVRIAKISDGTFSTDEEFGDRLQLDKQTGNIKITNIRATDSGLYKLKITRTRGSLEKTFNISVSADEVKTVSVMVGDTVTLHTDLTKTQIYDAIQWRFEHLNSPVAEISRAARILSTYDGPDGRFKDRLKLDCLTGSLTIRNISTTHSGVYEVDISISKHIIHKSFIVTVRDGVKPVSVTAGHPVTLQTGVTEKQTDDVILWMFGDTQITVNDDGPGGRLKQDRQTGSLTITDTKTEDSGLYELQIISSRRSIHRRFTVTVGSGLSAGAVVGICVAVLLVIGAVAAVIYHRRRTAELKRQRLNTQSVIEGEFVTLFPHDIEIREDDHILWKYKGTLIAERKEANGEITPHDGVHVGMVKGRLHLDRVSGSLTIKEARLTDSGRYELWIIRKEHELLKTFIVCVCVRTLSVTEGESVTLNPHNIKIREDDHILWKYKGTPIVEKKEANGEITPHDDVYKGMFKGRLHLDKKSGSLTIKEARLTDSGRYELSIIRAGHELLKTFTVSVCDPNNEMRLRRLFDSEK